MELERKLAILADAAKYDASCASSGTTKRNSRVERNRFYHWNWNLSQLHARRSLRFAPEILLTNYCIYDCLYCINRISSDMPRARFTIGEVVPLTLDFYRRNTLKVCFSVRESSEVPTTRWNRWSRSRERCALIISFAATFI